MNKVVQPNFLQELNSQQLAAVTYPDNKSLLVLAGAGSGKTRVLTTRIVWLLYTKQSVPQNILAVTFTNKAAKEMRSRIEQLLPYSPSDMWLGTFHSLCHQILRKEHKAAQLKSSFQVIDTQDQLSIVKHILKNQRVVDPDITPKKLTYYINYSKEKGYRSEHQLLVSNKLNNYYKIYEQICQKEQLVDFAELLLRCVEILQNNPLLQQSWHNRFHHILVDEFQDTNNLQYQWLKLIKGNQSTIFLVGDDDQSIYSFRGANIKNMSHAIKDFDLDQPIKLEQNYRSTQVILDAANQLIALNKNRMGKNLKSTQQTGESIKCIRTNSELEEGQYVVDEIKSLHNSGQNHRTIAILYRNNALSRTIEQSLSNANIPYRVYGGLRFYEREEIKHALAYLRLLVNPEDNHSLLRIINFPSRGIGNKTLNNLQTIAETQQISLWNALLQEKAKNKYLESFYQIIHHLQTQINKLTFPELMNELIDISGLIHHYEQKKGDFYNKIDNLHELVNATYDSSYQNLSSLLNESSQPATLKEKIIAFLSNASLETGEANSQTHDKNLTDYVQLMTIHSAKGLEFDTIFLIAMEEGLFPSEYSIKDPNNLEEERRLMYVAITRAKKRLYLSSVCSRRYQGIADIRIQSRFIHELPDHLIHHLLPKETTPSISAPSQSIENKILFNDSDEPYTLGTIVRHHHFGTGVIINKAKRSYSYLLTINFGKNGIKKLDSTFAKLEII